eukprot:CAMPEP_0182417230 /NCGR_PEP_ID=MMETSP1167-20130531/1662_1 /TAXON_ID=2988 /ORGANISM="Mallomonas Sp, Strain CCMP3275" /LENGTH=215 /DNA_ID=CAMNT_0024590639 /DNA_START=671 /DNA_END=1318 /DNA_ORIENTATION=+
MNIGLRSHYIASCYAFPLLKHTKEFNPTASPLIVHISSFGGVSYSFNVAYGVGKAGVDRMARDMALELTSYGINCVSLYPGVVRTERMVDILESGEFRKRTNLAIPKEFIETPLFTGRVIASFYDALDKKSVSSQTYNGKSIVVAELAKILGVVDVSGCTPPSLRSVRFLLPSLLLNQFKIPPKQLENILIKITPDVLLPMSFMEGGPPEASKSM